MVYDGKEYATSEHLYQSLRYINALGGVNLNVNLEYAELIRRASTATGAKMMGNQVLIEKGSQWKVSLGKVIKSFQDRGLRRVYLDRDANECMGWAVTEKLRQEKECLEKLLAIPSLDKIIYHGDEYWGIHEKIVSGEGPNAWREYCGQNQLGKILSQIREKGVPLS